MTDEQTMKKRKSVFIDHSTVASLSGMIKCNIIKYIFHYPVAPIFFVISQLSAYYFFALASFSLNIAFIVSLFLIFMYWKHIRAICWHGDLCPAAVISVSPLRLAVYTDLSQSQFKAFSVIKIIKPPFMTFGRKKPELGQRVAVVSMYQASEEYQNRWGNFIPKPVECLTFDKDQIKLSLQRIPQEHWDELDENLRLVTNKTTTPGLYHLGKLIG
jgi:hypothetical protein